MKRKRSLVLFDFDGTLTKKDTLFAFTRFAVGDFKYYLGIAFLSIPMVLHKLGLLSSQLTKNVFLTHFFSNQDFGNFEKLGKNFAIKILPGIVRPEALKMIQFYREKDVRMVIVTASFSEWIEEWSKMYGIELISTKLEVKNNSVTGKIKGENCNGVEKVNRIREILNLEEYDEIIAYGDSKGDLPMLSISTSSYFKPFRGNK